MKIKPPEELEKELREQQEELREARFRVARGEEKDVRRLRELRREVARILTALKS